MDILIAHDDPGGVWHTRPRGLPLFALLAAAACVAAAAPLAAQTRNPIWLVSPQDAGKAASALVAERASAKEGGCAGWAGAKIGEPAVYVDSAGDAAAYCFAVKSVGKPAGYVIVSARRFSEPIQEFSAGQPPHERYLAASRAAAEAKLGDGRKAGKPSFVYAGPLALAARFPAAEPRTPGEEVFVAMRTQTVLAPESVREPERAAEYLALTKAAWAAILSGREPDAAAPPEFRYLANMPAGLNPCRGDAAALAALFSFWGIRAAGETDAALCETVSAALAKSGGDEWAGQTQEYGWTVFVFHHFFNDRCALAYIARLDRRVAIGCYEVANAFDFSEVHWLNRTRKKIFLFGYVFVGQLVENFCRRFFQKFELIF